MVSARERLVEATRELLWERGYEATSPRAILERSGAGQGSLYHHFSGKVALAAVALEEVEEEMRARADAIFHSGGPPLERIEEYLRLPREALKGCRLGRIAPGPVIEQEGIRGVIASYFEHVQREIAAALREAQTEGELGKGIDAEELAATLFAVVQGGYVLARASQDPRQMDRAVNGALALLRSAGS